MEPSSTLALALVNIDLCKSINVINQKVMQLCNLACASHMLTGRLSQGVLRPKQCPVSLSNRKNYPMEALSIPLNVDRRASTISRPLRLADAGKRGCICGSIRQIRSIQVRDDTVLYIKVRG